MGLTRFQEKLRDQLKYLQASASRFDRGEEAEGIRMALSLRILFHQTSHSTSLFRHLGMDSSSMLSSNIGGQWTSMLDLLINLSSANPISAKPILGDKFTPVALRDWWHGEVIFEFQGKQFPRSKIVLTATNKDGGAHVDSRLEDFYEHLAGGTLGLSITGDLKYNGTPPFKQGEPHSARNMHLALLRQFAHEVLASAKYFKWL